MTTGGGKRTTSPPGILPSKAKSKADKKPNKKRKKKSSKRPRASREGWDAQKRDSHPPKRKMLSSTNIGIGSVLASTFYGTAEVIFKMPQYAVAASTAALGLTTAWQLVKAKIETERTDRKPPKNGR